MTLILNLTPQLERRLNDEASRHGISADECAVQLLEKCLPAEDSRSELVSLLRSWIDEGDAREQKETGDYLVQAIDEDRLSERKLFVPELKGISW